MRGKMIRTKTGSMIWFLCLLLAFATISSNAEARTGKVHLTEKIKQVPTRPAIFNQNIQPLAMQQCAQCHIGVFNLLKNQGKRHQKECTFCHEVYHTYAPGKVEYSEAIPKCADCHGLPHGDREFVQNCSKCHSNAHSPVNLPDITPDMCFNCHPGPPKAVKEFPSKHTDVACTDCHTSHGFIPNCTDCHSADGGEPFHMNGNQANKTCLDCHNNPHTPTNFNYAEDTPKEMCADCHFNESHARVYDELKKGNSKHFTDNTCASCHTVHGQIPSCFDCHDQEGHRQGLVDADCLRCHSNPHDPMNLVFAQDEPKKNCAGCHGEVYDTLMKSNTRHTQQTCTKCHPRHGEIPKCQKCHGVPHGDAMMKQFGSNCGSCHGIAHDVQGRMK